MNKNSFSTLNGMRGIAALFVLNRHTSDYWNFTIFRSYLAVDLFFILSGFVIAHAYDKKLNERVIKLKDFIFIRIIRLYPVYFLSLIVASAFQIYLICVQGNSDSHNAASLTVTILLTVFFIPSHLYGGNNFLFPLNGPYWSLFYELIVNFAYASLRKWLSIKNLIYSVVFFGAVILLSSLLHNGLDGGSVWKTTSFYAGILRALFGIFYGLLIYRLRIIIPNVNSELSTTILPILIMTLILLVPSVGRFDGLLDGISVILLFPLCIYLASLSKNVHFEKIFLILGTASYPIYVLHKPIADIFREIWPIFIHKNAPLSGLLLITFLIFISIIIEKYYDLPLRRLLTNITFNKNFNR